ncbi:hypothetical protein YC2023_011134 [Brassica napus]
MLGIASGLSENLYGGQRLMNRKRTRKADRDQAHGVNVLYWHVLIILDRRGEKRSWDKFIGRNGHYSGQQTDLSEFEEELPWVKIKRVLMELCS